MIEGTIMFKPVDTVSTVLLTVTSVTVLLTVDKGSIVTVVLFSITLPDSITIVVLVAG